MGACASKFKGFKDDVPALVEKEDVAAASRDVKIMEATVNKDEAVASRDVNIVEETVGKDEVPAAAADGEAKPRSLGHLLKEIEGEKGSVENGNATSPEPVAADAEAIGKAEKAPPLTEDIKLNNPEEKNVEEEDVKPPESENVEIENVGVEASDKKTEEKLLAETEKKKTEDKKTEEKLLAETEKKKTEEEPTETTKLETPTETIQLEAKNAETPTETILLEAKNAGAEKKIEVNKLTEDTKIETPGKVEEDDKHIVEPTKIDNHVENNKAAEVKNQLEEASFGCRKD